MSFSNSPIVWPSSEKKKKGKSRRERDAAREISKLSLKNRLAATPVTASPSQGLRRRSSIDTFHRVFHEMTGGKFSDYASPTASTEKHSLHNSENITPRALTSIRRSGLSCPRLNLLNTSGMNRPVARMVFDTSSDEETSPSILPLNQRVPLIDVSKHKLSRPGTSKNTPILLFDSSSDDGNSLVSRVKGLTFSKNDSLRTLTTHSNPELNNAQTAKTVPKSHRHKPEHIFNKAILQDKNLTVRDVLVLSDSSSDEPKKSNHKEPATLPKTFRPKQVSKVLRIGSPIKKTSFLPKDDKDSPNMWISKEEVAESSKFLKSLSDGAPLEPSSAHFRTHFKKHKEELVKKLYNYFNLAVFDKKLPAEMSITWNIRLTKTAGYCYMKTHHDKTKTARIELSTKVLDSAERLRDTLLHELCHAAGFLVHGYREGHGPIFKHWGRKACIIYPFLPVVSVCHTYDINTKFVYECIQCKARVGRHSKSLDINKKGCGRCGSRFQLFVNGKKPKTTTESSKCIKDNQRSSKHTKAMKKLNEEFSIKASVFAG